MTEAPTLLPCSQILVHLPRCSAWHHLNISVRHSSWLSPSHSLWRTTWHQVALTSPGSSSDPSAVSKLPHSRGITGGRMRQPFSPRAVQEPALFAWLQALDTEVSSSRSWLPESTLCHWEAQQAWQSLQDGRVPLSRCRKVSGCPYAWDPGRGFTVAFFRHCLFTMMKRTARQSRKEWGLGRTKEQMEAMPPRFCMNILR